jgi:hypothetical protein
MDFENYKSVIAYSTGLSIHLLIYSVVVVKSCYAHFSVFEWGPCYKIFEDHNLRMGQKI